MSPAADVSPGRPRVTAVIVAHDGAPWLPRLLGTLENQTRLPDRLVAVDTGSRDDTGDLLRAALGPDAVVTTGRGVGFGAAVRLGLQQVDAQAATAAWLADPDAGHADEWFWVLHDDMQLDPHALDRLLDAVRRDPALALVGPKVREWPQRRRLLEVGLTVTGTARRLTGVDPGEYDQGQHDRDRDTLAVGSAGMLARRLAWDRLEGFDPDLPLFGDDVDLGWRAARAGMRVSVAPAAVVFHAEAAARGRRSIDAATGRPHRLAREHALHTVLANCRGWALALVAVRLLLGSLLRAVGLLLVKAPRDSWDEAVAVVAALGRPRRLWRARRRRRRLPRSRAARVRPLLAPWWAPYAQGLELVGQLAAETTDALNERNRRASRDTETGPVAEEAQNLAFEPGMLSWVLSRPMGVAVVVLTLLSPLAGADVLGAGLLQGGALLPAPPGAGDWWRTYLESWHPVTLGSDIPAPPYVAVLGAFATLLLGKAWLVVDLLLGFTVPLTALAGYVLARRLLGSRPVAVWAAVAYGLLPVLTGAVAQGRLGTVAAAMVLPLLVRCALAAVGSPVAADRWRAAVGAGLLLAVLAAFVPLGLPMALVVAAGYWLVVGRDRGLLLRLAVMAATAVLLLLPWLPHLGADPARWALGEAGFAAGVPGDLVASRWEVLLGRPGGPGQAPVWLTAGLLLAALVALVRTDRRRVVLTTWGVGLVGLAAVALQQREGTWPGFAVLLVQAAVVAATAVVADGALDRLGGASFGWRQPVFGAVALAALLAPVLGAGWWLVAQQQPVLHRAGPLAMPAFMADAQQTPRSPRTLLVSADGSEVSVHLSRGPGLYVGQDAVAVDPPAQLTDVAARLVTEPAAADVAALADQGVGFVLLSGSDAAAVAAVDTAPGLVRSSSGELPGTAWRLDAPAGPVRVGAAHGAPTDARVLAGRAGSVQAGVASGLATRTLVLGEQADPGWRASLDGEDLGPMVVDGWAQGFDLGAGGGRLVVDHETGRGWWLAGQAVALLLALVLVAPGRRSPERGSDEGL